MSPLTIKLDSQNHWLADGTQTVWNFDFSGGYINKSHVRAYMESNDVDPVRTDLVIDPDSDFVGPYQIDITPAVPANYTLVIYRATPKDLPLVDFQDGGGVTELNLDTATRQAVFLAQESADFLGVTTTADLQDLAQTALAAAGSAAASATNAEAFADLAGVNSGNAAISASDAADSAAAAATSAANAASAATTIVNDAFATYSANLLTSVGASLVGWIHSGIGAVLRTVQSKLRDTYSPLDYGCVGDNVVDDTANLLKAFAAVPAYGTLDLLGKTYRITAPMARPAVGVKVRNGRLRLDNAAAQFFYALTANDYCVFEGIYVLGAGVTGTAGTPKYHGGIVGGNTGYPAPMNTAPANYVQVRGCTFDSLTVGVWSGGASVDAVPVGWRVVDNALINIVGFAGQSEGYGVLFTPTNNGVLSRNTFKTIRRHAIYIAGESSHNVISENVIDGCDNIAIQSNTSVTQNTANGNVYLGNIIKNLTRSIAYGYRSAIGIGLYGKHANTVVSNNRIFSALDTGIDSNGELSGSPYSDRLTVSGNQIVMDSTATDAGIRIDGLLSGKIGDNHIKLQAANYGIIVTSTVGSSTEVIDITDNTIDTTNASAVGFRVALTGARVLRVFRNTLNGFALATYLNAINDTSAAGTVRTDLNSRVGFFGSDAGFTHNSGGTVANTDCPRIRHAGTLTAARTITLAETNVDSGATVTIMRTGAGAFNLNVNTGASLVKALTTGQWATFAYNQSGQWELAGFGSL